MIVFGLGLALAGAISCDETPGGEDGNVGKKVSSELLAQVGLRRQQIAQPTEARLQQMIDLGMDVSDLEIQRIYIHMEQAPDASQSAEMEALGITLYPDSWIPPVGVHPTGFLLADMPVDSLEELADKEYVVSLDTAEHVLMPQSSPGMQPQ